MENKFMYYIPTKIVYGIDSINEIEAYIMGRKTLLLTTEGFVRRGLADRINSLTEHIVEVVAEVKSHPEFKDLEMIYNKVQDIDFDIILAIGGGSVIDASKFLSVKNKSKKFSFVDDLTRGRIPKENYSLTPIISIPTTSGTGSELTPWATIWDMDEKKKYSLHLPDLYSEVALYDPTLTLSVPKELTIQTGLDTLSHALESIWNKKANLITVNYAVESAKLIMDYLPKLASDLENIEYRDKIMRSCMYAGLAFSNTQTAIAHAMSYFITAHKGVPHGIACSFTLPMLVDNIIGKYNFIDEALVKIFGELSSHKLKVLFKKLDIPIDFMNYISKTDLIHLKKSLVSNQRTNNSLFNIKTIL